jgi:hypothetical protein
MLSTLIVLVATLAAPGPDTLQSDFSDPPLCFKSRPLWFWNAPVSDEKTTTIMEGCKAVGYYGFGILPSEKAPAFMGKEYLDAYQFALDKAAALGMKMCLYDEYWFPSGSAGGHLKSVHPEALSKRLDKAETEVTGPRAFSQPLPEGQFMGAAAMNTATKEIMDISGGLRDGALAWDAPAGTWKVMLFSCVTDGARDLVDYLSPEAVQQFAALTYQKYYDRFPNHFGTTIDSAFYDEPTMHWVQGGRAWTGAFNAKFEQKYGTSPVPCYPALWYDIGEGTAAARNALFGFRAELYATGFPKGVTDWCREHGIQLMGHMDQEEIVNPTGLCGDLMKCFQYQDIPGIDEIFTYGRGSKAYKVVSSAAYNYGKQPVMCETYGAIKDMPVATLYREAMDLFAKGVNMMIPHAVWYDDKHITFEPELSHRTEPYASALPEYNKYIGRLQRVMQQGRHVSEVGVLYPIAALQAGYYFDGPAKPYEGGVIPEEADYMDIGEMLALHARRDYVFLHPDVLDRNCVLDGPCLRLDTASAHEELRVVILPGAKVIHASNLAVVKRFWELGGKVIATTQLPFQSAEFGKDAEVRQMITEIFGPEAAAPVDDFKKRPDRSLRRDNAAGGVACFVERPTPDRLRGVLQALSPVPDLSFEGDPVVKGGNLSYIHKTLDGRDVYFLANSSDTSFETAVRIRGEHDLEQWNPHTGAITECMHTHITDAGNAVTIVPLRFPPVHSVFLISKAG